jgi:hypothetical protein
VRDQLRVVVACLGLVLLCFALAHAFEDFAYGVPHERFGVDTSPGAALLAVAFVVQMLILYAGWRGTAVAYLANAGVGVAWLLAAALDHLGEVLTHDPYRAGVFSKLLEVGIMISGVALLVVAGAAAYLAMKGATEAGRR